MEALKDTIAGVMNNLALKKEKANLQADPWVALKKALTKKELKHIKFNYFNRGILGVKVDSSAWLYSFSLKRGALLSLLKNTPGIAVKDIRFSIGEVV